MKKGVGVGAQGGASAWGPRAAVPLLLFVVSFCAFLPALSGAFLNWDDELLLVGNGAYRGFTPAHLKWMFTTFLMGPYQPLSWVTYALDHAVWGMNPAGYHLTNVVLHAANAVALFAVILALLSAGRGRAGGRARASTADVLAAGAGSLFFAVHPLRVESVAWVTERRDVLSGFYFLLSVLAYVTWRGRPGKSRWYAASLGCFVLSVLAKAMGMTLPLVLWIIDAYPLRRFVAGSRRRVLLEKAPFLAVSVATAVVAVMGQRSAGAVVGDLGEYSVAHRAAQSAYGLVFYMWKTMAPVGLSPIYPLNPGFDPLGAVFVACAVIAAAVTAGLLAVRRRAPWALGAWAAYVVLVSPVLGWMATGPQIAADRYTYLASLPWSVVVGAGVARAGRGGAALRRAMAGGAVVVLAVLGVLTFQQSRLWRDSFTLFDHALKVNDANPRAFLLRGLARQARGEHREAIEDFSSCLRLDPNDPGAYNNRGASRQAMGDFDGAIADYGEAIRVDPKNAQAFANRGGLRRDRGDRPGAAADLEAAIRLDPGNSQAYGNRGLLRLDVGQQEAARGDFDRALDLDPRNVGAYLGRALLRRVRGDLNGALSDLDRAAAVDPAQAQIYSNRGTVRLARGDREGALRDFESALRLGARGASAYLNRGIARLELGDASGALADFDESLRLAPGNASARAARERALAALGSAR